jgi:hypothetical protein
MSFQRTELRAYPRLSWAHPARLVVTGLQQHAQVVDLSLGGCKLMPSDLVMLIEGGLGPGMSVGIEIEGRRLDAVVRWVTPNCSAMGCAFEIPLSEEDLRSLDVRISDAANTRPAPPPRRAPPAPMLVAS